MKLLKYIKEALKKILFIKNGILIYLKIIMMMFGEEKKIYQIIKKEIMRQLKFILEINEIYT